MTEAGTEDADAAAWGASATERGIRGALAAVLAFGLCRRNPGAVVNALLALAATYVPDAVERRYTVRVRPWQRVVTGMAMLVHAVGMLGPYDEVWWWDHLTHLLSATLLGGLVHGRASRRDLDPRPRVLVGVMGVGVLWELVEYAIHVASRRVGLEPVLVSYGRADTAFDLLFDLLGALVVVAFGDRLFGNLGREE